MLKITAQKTGFSVTDFYSKCDWFTADLVKFADKILKIGLSPYKNLFYYLLQW